MTAIVFSAPDATDHASPPPFARSASFSGRTRTATRTLSSPRAMGGIGSGSDGVRAARQRMAMDKKVD
jgi:hypothetical protein